MIDQPAAASGAADAAPPHESYSRLFLRFLRFGLLAWGGPVAQIAMIKQELVEEERWITRDQFNRVLAIYQVLPGPEAHELCVYFGVRARGRIGGVLAGLGFMLPGFVLMFLLSWAYVRFGLASPLIAAIFFGFKPAVGALIIRAVHRIGQHALKDRWLWGIAVAAGVATLLQVHFLIILALAGLVYGLVRRGAGGAPAAHVLALPLLAAAPLAAAAAPGVLELFGYGLRAGLLTFGGAYTAIPLLQYDAVEVGGWMTDAQFVDGLALSGILPAPLIIFTTFVGYLGGGPAGALALTAGAFLPAFLFSILGHGFFERLTADLTVQAALDGVTAAVVGLILVTSVQLLWASLPAAPAEQALAAVLFALSLAVLYRWKSKLATVAVVLGAALLGFAALFALGSI
ncbi:MAG TPA: chromate efflux transporter [Roseiflexaceae bacterium]|nr:chromate efflux transporter [Roseiflexaceae bacterium]